MNCHRFPSTTLSSLCLLLLLLLLTSRSTTTTIHAITIRPVTITSPSRTQTVNVHLPNGYTDSENDSNSDTENGDFPIILLFHGLFGSGAGISSFYDMNRAADQLGFIYIAPQAYHNGAANFHSTAVDANNGNNGWCASTICCCGGRTLTCNNQCEDDSALDADFVRDMIVHVSRVLNIDVNRVYLMGVSNGAYMAYRTACENSHLIAGIVAVCGGFNNDIETRCRSSSSGQDGNSSSASSQPVHVLHIHGTRDSIVPYAGLSNFLDPTPELVRNWALSINQCSGSVNPNSSINTTYLTNPQNHNWGRNLNRVLPVQYQDCSAETELWSVPRVGHCPGIDYFNLNWILDKRKYNTTIADNDDDDYKNNDDESAAPSPSPSPPGNPLFT